MKLNIDSRDLDLKGIGGGKVYLCRLGDLERGIHILIETSNGGPYMASGWRPSLSREGGDRNAPHAMIDLQALGDSHIGSGHGVTVTIKDGVTVIACGEDRLQLARFDEPDEAPITFKGEKAAVWL